MKVTRKSRSIEEMLENRRSSESSTRSQPDSVSHGLPSSLSRSARSIPGIVIGVLDAVEIDGQVTVDFPDNPFHAAIPARSIVCMRAEDVGRSVALAFEREDPAYPVVLGFLQESVPGEESSPIRATFDGERLLLEADKEIVLRCGKASITLTRAGKILIRGAYLLSRSSGVNRIKGGSVQIN